MWGLCQVLDDYWNDDQNYPQLCPWSQKQVKFKRSSGSVFKCGMHVQKTYLDTRTHQVLGNIPGFYAFFSRTIKWGHWRALFFFFNLEMDHFVCLSPPETGQVINSCFRGQWFSYYLFSCCENCGNSVLANLVMGRWISFNVLYVIQGIKIIFVSSTYIV